MKLLMLLMTVTFLARKTGMRVKIVTDRESTGALEPGKGGG